MLDLPRRLLIFWYPQALICFFRFGHNLTTLLEEDLAVGLMLKLIFVPLFHDSTALGRILSFSFRAIRILTGLFSFALAALLVTLLVFSWFASPAVLAANLFLGFLPPPLNFFPGFILFLGIALFIDQLINNPAKKVWQIKKASEVWQATKLKKSEINWPALIQTEEVKELLALLEVSPSNFASQNVPLSEELFGEVLSLAKYTQARFITPSYFWLGMLSILPGVENELMKLNLSLGDFKQALNFLELKRKRWRRIYLWDEDFAVKHLKGVNRGWLGVPTPALDRVSADLTKKAAEEKLADFAGREGVVSEVVNILSQERDRNVLLVGMPGVGKSTLANFLAKMIIAGDAPSSLATKRVVALSLPKLLSGIENEGDLASRIKEVFEEIEYAGEIILVVDEIQELGLGDAGKTFNLYSLLFPYLESDKFQFIATTESLSYTKILEKNGAFARVFNKVEVPPASLKETAGLLEEEAVNLLRSKRTYFTYLAIKTLGNLAAKLVHDRVLPDSALAVLRESVVLAKDGRVTSQIAAMAVEQKSRIPVFKPDGQQKETLLGLEDIIHQRLVGQEDAVKAVADTLRRSAVSLRESSRPIGSFLFVGSTGVGKTELAKILAEVYFKSKNAFIRFDMSEFSADNAAGRLIGTEDSPGELTEAVKNRPYSLLLLDEFEKANTKVIMLFLQVLEDGRLTDAAGTVVDLTNTIIIATSNVSSLTIARGLREGLALKELEVKVRDELMQVFKPELINRFDQVVLFKPLAAGELEQIVQIRLAEVISLLREQGFLVKFSAELVRELGKRGFDPSLGARPLRRLIQDTLEARLSRLILEGKLKKGELAEVGLDLLYIG